MYALSNRVQLIGNLGQDPEIRTYEGGKKKASFSMATNESYRNAQGESVKETQWHNVVAWGKLADTVEKHLAKGREVVIEGRLNNRSYTDKEGQKKYVTEVVANEVLLLGKKETVK
ncbi:single-stranded DNA-binding protein [Flaviaesturariibacter aridisoli]|uniref:Single-stranded DNA-binding protein n=1 Tax=Flaviaesturariibacter aridisoli TaxID=2545761 RepID=A0A4R4E0K4_9BACT|nr:single-stranded DNA-binding protein [Flaviaesturariibacter aridisoli]TCZ70502.1 single-stranded DNA-binding protein [Flaviaesturariibacter aridisoli]